MSEKLGITVGELKAALAKLPAEYDNKRVQLYVDEEEAKDDLPGFFPLLSVDARKCFSDSIFLQNYLENGDLLCLSRT